MIKIGLLLGSFDPFHIGHLYSAVQALEQGMDCIKLVPAWQNPWKQKSTSFDLRILMILYSLKGYTKIKCDGVEGTLKPTYTYETLLALKKKYNKKASLYIIGGEDTIQNISKWTNGQWIIDNFKFLCIPRNKINISSSEIREMIKHNQNPYPFIHHDVFKLIQTKKLYL